MASLLTAKDKAVLSMAARWQTGGFRVFTKHYFGWDPQWYQFVYAHAQQPNVTMVTGIGAGKTESAAYMEAYYAILNPYFSYLHTSTTTPQAELAYVMLNRQIEMNPEFAKFIEDIKVKPYPTILYKNGSRGIYRTVGYEAKNIRGDEFDLIVMDEAGYEEKRQTIHTLRGRLRGHRPDGRPRWHRLDCISSPTDAEWLIERFERGDPQSDNYDPRRFFSLRVATFDNKYLTPAQLEELTADYPEELARVELYGHFPDYGLSEFSRASIDACEDASLNDLMEYKMGLVGSDGGEPTGKKAPGYEYVVHPRHGILKWEEPADPNRIYLLAGDPGTDGPPRRNAAVVMVFDVTEEPSRMVYFDWIDGNGSYFPFLNSFKYAMQKYKPVIKGMDSTGQQKAIDELAFESKGLLIDPVNFQDKDAMLNALKFAISQAELRFPRIAGLRRQLRDYRRKDDKLAQDLVVTLMMVAHLKRFLPSKEAFDLDAKISRIDTRVMRTSRSFAGQRRSQRE